MTHRTGDPAAWPSEHEVADELPVDCTAEEASRVLAAVPFWFHTFSLNATLSLYTPGVARDHGYRLASIPRSFAGMSVLDVGAFDGFYSFLAEHRGAERVVAVDNEQYRYWVRDRWGIELQGGEGFHTIARLIASNVEYARVDAYDLSGSDERFDFIICFGILHRVENPLGLLRVLLSRLLPRGRLLIETAGVRSDAGATEGAIHVARRGAVNARDDYFYWQFTSGALRALAEHLDAFFETHATPVVAGQPRIIGHIGVPSVRTDRSSTAP